MLPPESPFFTVEAVVKKADARKKHDTASGKVAPGMEVQYKVTFSPRGTEDYAVDLVAVTEREKFVVPIRATGVRVRLPTPARSSRGAVPERAPGHPPRWLSFLAGYERPAPGLS